LKKKVKWVFLQLFARNLRQKISHRLIAWIKTKEKLREVEYRKNPLEQDKYASTEKEGKQSDVVLTYFEEELKLLEEWLASNPKVEEGCIAVADTKHPRTPKNGIIIEEDVKKKLS
jgi:hypothetical protein